MLGKKSKVKKELMALIQNLLKTQDAKYFLLFKLLNELRAADIQTLLNESSKLEAKENKSAQLLSFRSAYPIMCMVDVFTVSSTLSTSVLINTINEVLAESNMISPQEKKEFVEDFNTNRQTQGMIESYFLAFLCLTKGSQIDLKGIANQVNKKYSHFTPIDGDMMDMVQSVSQHSADGFEQMIFKLGCSQSREMLLEFFKMMNLSRQKFPKICNSLSVVDQVRDSFSTLIYILYYISAYDYAIQLTVGSDKKRQKSATREISIIRQKMQALLAQLKDETGKPLEILKIQEIQDLIGGAENDETQSKGEISSRGEYVDLEQLSQRSQGDEELSIEQKYKIMIKKLFPSKKSNKDIEAAKDEEPAHLKLWHILMKKYQSAGLNDYPILPFIKYSAIMLLRVNGKIGQNDPIYVKCLKDYAIYYELSEDQFEIFVDAILGNPLDIFKLQNKGFVEYNIKDDEEDNQPFQGTFDNLRMSHLMSLFKGSEKTLSSVCLKWYHQFLYFQEGKETLYSYFMKDFNLDLEFIDIVQMFNQSQSEGDEKQEQTQMPNMIQEYLRNQIRQSRLQQKNQTVTDNYQITNSIFSPEGEFKIEEFKKVPNDQLMSSAQVMEKLIQLKTLEKSILRKILGEDPSRDQILTEADKNKNKLYQKFLKCFLQIGQDPLANQILDFLRMLSELIQLQKPQGGSIFGGGDKVTGKQRGEIISLALILNSYQFSVICKDESNDIMMLGQSIFSLLDLEPDTYSNLEEKEFPTTLAALHDNGFLTQATINLMKPLNETMTEKNAKAILGLMMGQSTNNKKMIRNSLLKLLDDKDIKNDVLEGFIGIFLEDIEAEASIKSFSSVLDLDGDLMLKLVDLSSNETRNFPSILMELLSSNSEKQDQQICQSFLSMIKGDLSSARILISKLSVDQTKAMPILASAIGNMTILSEFYSDIAQYLGITSQKAVRFLMYLAHGDASVIKKMSNLRAESFYIYEPELAESLYKLTYAGHQIYSNLRSKKLDDLISTSDCALNVVSKKISQVYGLPNDKVSSFIKSVKILIKSCWNDNSALLAVYKKLQKNAKNSIWYSSESKSKIAKLLSEKEILEFLKEQIKSVVIQSQKVPNYIERSQKEILKKLTTVVLKKLSSEFKKKEEEAKEGEKQEEEKKEEDKPEEPTILEKAAKAIEEKVSNLAGQAKIDPFKDAIKQIESLNTLKPNEKYDTAVNSLSNEHLVNAYKVGCTFGLSLYKRFEQPFYSCQTCSEVLGNETIGVCQICALFCHAGHTIQKASDQLVIQAYCNCGSGEFNECDQLNSENPIASCKNQNSCSVLHSTYDALLAKSKDFIEEEKKSQPHTQNTNELSKYSVEQFLKDITLGLQLPKYLEKQTQDLGELIKNNVIKEDQGLSLLFDNNSNSFKTLAENLILLAQGQISSSFLSILSVKKNYTFKDSMNENPYAKKSEKSSNLPLYQTLTCLVALAQQNQEKFMSYGQGFASVMGEVGTREQPAVEKLLSILMLAKGGELPDVDEDTESKKFKNQYVQIFKDLFGIRWKGMITLHKTLTLTSDELIDAMNLNDIEGEKDSKTKKQVSEQILKLSDWIDLVFFEHSLKISETSIEYCKKIIGLICRHGPSFDFIADERGISGAKAKTYKALVYTKGPVEMQPIFQKLAKQNMPEVLIKHLQKMLIDSDQDSYISFIMKYLEIKSLKGASWSQIKGFELGKSELLKHQVKYVSTLYSLMSGDVNDLQKQLNFIISRYLSKKLHLQQEEDQDPKLINALISLFGLLNQDQQLASKLAVTLDKEALSDAVLDCIISVLRNNQTSKELKTVIQVIAGESVEGDTLSDCKNILTALQGDLIALTTVVDKLSNNDNNLRSFVASLITGQTRYDSVKGEAQELGKNLLLREVFRVFEKAVKENFPEDEEPSEQESGKEDEPPFHKTKEEVNEFIEKAFKQRVPLYLIMLLTEDRNLMEGLFKFEDQFVVSLKAPNPGDKDKKYLKNFLEFINPDNPDVSIKNIYRYCIKIPKSAKLDYPIIPEIDQEIQAKQNFFKIDLLDFLNLIFNTLTSSNPIPALTNLVDEYMIKSLQKVDMLKKVLSLQHGLMTGEDLFKNLPAFIELIMRSLKLEIGKDNLIDVICQWFQVIMNMLSKERKTPSDTGSKLTQSLKSTIQYYGEKLDNPLASRKDNLLFVSDAMTGLIGLTKGDLMGIKPLAIKIGGFPQSMEKLEQFIKLAKQNKEGLSIKSMANMASMAAQQVGGALISQIPIGNLPGGTLAQGLMTDAMNNPAEAFDPKNIFKHFCNSKGTMGFEEFQNMFRQLGIQIPHARMLQIFSLADKEKKGELNYQGFIKALESIKGVMINEIMAQMGMSIQDMAITFAFSIIILILMLVFIFVGIGAFAPSSSFSSVTNSMMPLGAGASVNKQSGEKEEDNQKPAQVEAAPSTEAAPQSS